MVAEIQNLVSWELTCPSYPSIYGSGDLPDSEGEDEIVECSVCLQSKKNARFLWRFPHKKMKLFYEQSDLKSPFDLSSLH